MMERLQKIIASRGLCSRRQAEELIASSRVTVNGVVAQLGQTADPERDEIRVDGKLLPTQGKKIYLMLHKPRGYVTTLSDERGRKNVAQLVAGCGERVYPVGRLDMDSEGLLLFTNDGEFADLLMHPSHEVNKTYRVVVKGFSTGGLERLSRPMTLDGYKLRIPDVKLIRRSDTDDKAELEITIHEGRNRQVRRMCAIARMTVIRLTRVAEGPVTLGNLKKGEWRYLTDGEVESLRK